MVHRNGIPSRSALLALRSPWRRTLLVESAMPDARAIADELTTRQISLSLGGSGYDPIDAVGRLLFNVLAMVAEFSVIWTRRCGDLPEVGAAA